MIERYIIGVFGKKKFFTHRIKALLRSEHFKMRGFFNERDS